MTAGAAREGREKRARRRLDQYDYNPFTLKPFGVGGQGQPAGRAQALCRRQS